MNSTIRKSKGKVRPPRKTTNSDLSMPETLALLSKAITQIHDHCASQLSFEEHYRYAYNLVLYKQGHTLYNKVAEIISNHLEQQTKEIVVPSFPSFDSNNNMINAAAGQSFLEKLKRVWDDHIACMGKLRDVLKYMDKVYTGSISLPVVWDLGHSLFLHHVILFSTNPPKPKPVTTSRSAPPLSGPKPTTDTSVVAHHLIATLLSQIRIEREGEPVSRSTLKRCVLMLSELTDEGPVPLPITASTGIGSGVPVMGVGLGGNNLRGKPVMGVGMIGDGDSTYRTSFETPFLQQSEEFYRKESAQLLIDCDAPSFCQRIDRRLSEEADRAQTYLSPSTEPLLITLLEGTLITTHLEAILYHSASGLSTLVQDSRISDLQRIYQLFGRVNTGHDALRLGLSKWIIEVGKQVNDGLAYAVAAAGEDEVEIGKGKGKAIGEDEDMEKAKPKKRPAGDGVGEKTKAALGWVKSVLDLKDKFDKILLEAFGNDKAFEKAINDAFTVFVNANPKSPEYISLFIDENLKKGMKGATDEEIDGLLDKSIALFRFLTEKDVFEKYYNSHLAKRLIAGRSVSDDAERGMLAKFKIEAGAAFTKSADGMMKDIKISEDMRSPYKRYQNGPNPVIAGFDMSVIVCGMNFWPISKQDKSCNLPTVLQQGVKSFSKYYDSAHSGRILTFHPELGSVDVKVRFERRTHELTLSTHGMVVLALFEGLGNEESLSYTEIAATTGIPISELKRTLQSLACAKFKILTKSPKGRDVDDTDVFSFNSGFTCPLAKIKIQMVANKVESNEERKETDIQVDEQRSTLCDACIVRVMKDRKTLNLTELVNEVIKQLSIRFPPSVSMVKKAIERSIDKEYIERDERDKKILRYLA